MQKMMTLWKLMPALPYLVLGLGTIESIESFAQTSSTNYSSPTVSNRFRDGSTTGSLSLMQSSFVSPDYRMTSQRDFQYLLVDIHQNKSGDMSPGVQLGADLSGLVSPNNQVLNYLNIRELFLEYKQLSLGRKKKSWSALEDYWPVGLYQPLFKWNPLMPESQGLTGLFLDLLNPEEYVPVKLSMMGSFLFIPDQQSPYRLQDGQFQFVNPWFRPPPQSAQFDDLGQVTDRFNYEIEVPSTQQVVFRRSFMAQLKLGPEESPWDFNVGWASKPSNQLAVGAKGFQQFNGTTQSKIRPQVFEHSLTSSDLSYRMDILNSQLKAGLSLLREKPSAPEFPADYTYNTYSESALFSPYLKYNWKAFEFLATYLEIQGGVEQTVGPQADRFKDFLPQRFPYRRAYQAQTKWTYDFTKRQAVSAHLNYLSGIDTQFARWWTEIEYQFEKKWKASVDVFLVQSANNALFSQYENNDFTQVGVSYVF